MQINCVNVVYIAVFFLSALAGVYIDYEFLHNYQNYLYSREIKPNSVYLYIRTIRIFYKKPIKLKLVDKSLYPFDDFKLRPEKTRKRAIDKDLINKIKDLPLKENTTIWHVRNWFMLSFYLIGISVVDLALLLGFPFLRRDQFRLIS